MSRSITVWYTRTNTKRFFANENGKTSRISEDQYRLLSGMALRTECIHSVKHRHYKTLTI